MATALVTPTPTPLDLCQDFSISRVDNPEELLTHLPQLCQILQDYVHEGSSIGFFAPLSLRDAEAFWKQVSEVITKGNLHVFILTLDHSTKSHIGSHSIPQVSTSQQGAIVLGTVQVVTIPKVTHLHRAEVVKLLVSPSARRLGVARKLMSHVENFARGIGRQILTLDTATASPAVEMYRHLG